MKVLEREQDPTEEKLNTLSHGLTFLTTIAGLVVLIVFGAKSEKELSLFSALLYGISLALLYLSSTLYHYFERPAHKRFFKIADHSSIFLLIAGTYTPFLLITIGGTTGWVIFGLQWGFALTGIILKMFFTGKYKYVSVGMYVMMGWMIVFKIRTLFDALPDPAFWLIIGGGISYTIGVLFYLLDSRLRFGHFIWHLFVTAGSVLHYLAIILYII